MAKNNNASTIDGAVWSCLMAIKRIPTCGKYGTCMKQRSITTLQSYIGNHPVLAPRDNYLFAEPKKKAPGKEIWLQM